MAPGGLPIPHSGEVARAKGHEMRRTLGGRAARALLAIGLTGLAVGIHPVPAAAAPTLTDPPTRLYWLTDSPVPLPFSDSAPGTFDPAEDDPISGQSRAIVVATAADDAACNPTDGNNWSFTGCVTVHVEGVTHGELAIPVDTDLNDPGDPEAILAGGSILQSSTNGDGTGNDLRFTGSRTEVNASLQEMTYTADAGYQFDGTNEEELRTTVTDADGTVGPVTTQIRVHPVNDFPTLTVPAGPINVAVDGTVDEPVVEPAINDLGTTSMDDVDIDDAPEFDGRALLVMFSTCGEFSLRGSLPLVDDIEQALVNLGFDQDAAAALVALLPPEVTAQTFGTGNALDPHSAIAAIGTWDDEINYALGQITFDAPAQDDDCDLWTIVSDLGDTGLPLSYEGDPPTGFEIPAFGVAFDKVTYIVGNGAPDITVSMPETLSVPEGDPAMIPLSASAEVPEQLDFSVSAADGTAAEATDYDDPPAMATIAGATNGTTITAPTTQDTEDEDPDETFTVTADLSGMPDDVVVGNLTTEVTIVDDDDPVDNAPPDVTVEKSLGQADPTSTSPVSFTITFTEPVSGFTLGDVELGASTVGGVLTPSLSGGPTVYTVTAEGMTTAGDVVASVPAGVAADAAGNLNTASTSMDNVVEWQGVVDDDDPTVTLEQGSLQPDPTSISPIVFDIEFSEGVTGFVATDVDLSASTAGGMLGRTVTNGGDLDPATYTLYVDGMTTSGDVVASIPAGGAEDGAGNLAAASTSTDDTVAWEVEAPTVTIDQGATQGDPTSVAPIVFDVEFSEAVTGFDATDVDLSTSTVGGTLTPTVTDAGDADAATYTVSVTGMTTSGVVRAGIGADAAIDTAFNGNAASTSTDDQVTWAQAANLVPLVTIDQAAAQQDPTSIAPIAFEVQFTEVVTGFTAADVDLTGSTAGGTLAATVSGSGSAFIVEVTGMTGDGDVVATVPAGGAADADGGLNTASTSTDNRVTWSQPDVTDTEPPSLTVEQADDQSDPTGSSSIHFVAAFSEPVDGFDAEDIDLDGSTTGGPLVATVTNRDKAIGTTFDIYVTGMQSTGDVVVSVPSGAAVDAAGNVSSASTSADNVVRWLLTYDPYAPYDPYDPGSYSYDPGTYDPGTAYGDGLARTGGPLASLVVIGLGAIAVGTGLALSGRRRSAAS